MLKAVIEALRSITLYRFTTNTDYEHLSACINSTCLLYALITIADPFISWPGASFIIVS